MTRRPLLGLVALSAAFLPGPQAFAQTPPADTYFSLAVTEDSHNHTGARRLFLDFQEPPFAGPDEALGVVASVRVAPGAITLDGSAADWDPTQLVVVHGLVQNNYPLSEFIDAVRTDITVGSAWDADHVYFLVRWEDAGHTASTRIKKWIFGDQGAGQTGWNQQVHIGATPGAPNEAAPNSSGHVLAGAESEDRVFFMFPIVDPQGHFSPNGTGCAFYCHPNLDQDFPYQNYTGKNVAVMHTNLPGEKADIWHWKSSRTHPSGFADDKVVEFAIGTEDGRRADAGTAAYAGNDLGGGNPTLMHWSGLSYLGDVLLDTDAVPFAGSPLAGDEIPRHVSSQPTGSRGDVETAASYDPIGHVWTIELRRLRDTGNPDDHSFGGADAPPPTLPLVTSVSPATGASLYAQNCLACHAADGRGVATPTNWVFARVQRASGSAILHAIQTIPFMAYLAGSVDEQDIEDIAAYLQTLATFEPVEAFGSGCADLVARWENSPKLGATDFRITLTNAQPISLAVLAVGMNRTSWLGVPLPLDLGSFGAPTCWLLVPPTALVFATTDPGGAVSQPVPIGTSPALVGLKVFAQWAANEPAFALGFAFSDGLAITIQP